MSQESLNSTGQAERVASAWSRIANCLEEHKKQLYAAIRAYPTPITACDQQFNFLLEQQAAILAELRRMRETQQAAAPGDAISLIEEFVRSSGCLDDPAKQAIRSSLSEERSKPAV